MKCKLSARTLGMLFVAGLVVNMAATAVAKDNHPECTSARAAGEWEFTTTGTVVGLGPVAAVGRLTLDAAGNVAGTQTRSLNGRIAHETLTGTYTVDPDCRGTAIVDVSDESGALVRTATLDGVFVDDMTEFREIFTSLVLPGGTNLATVLTIDGKKLFPKKRNKDNED